MTLPRASLPLLLAGLVLAVPLLTGADGSGCGEGEVVIGDYGGGGGSAPTTAASGGSSVHGGGGAAGSEPGEGGSEPGEGGAPGSGFRASCGSPATAEVAFHTQDEFDALIVGQWIHCGGPIPTDNDSTVVTGQVGVEFGAYQPAPNWGSIYGLLPGSSPGAGYTVVTPTCGGAPGSSTPPSCMLYWEYASETNQGPGVAYVPADATAPVVFTDSGNKMTMPSWSIYPGTYVRYQP